MTSRRFWIAAAIVGVGLAFALIVRSGGVPAEPERANLGFTLKDMNGSDVKLSDYAGKPLVVNLWATWCAPCRLEMPQLVALSEQYKQRGLSIVGISIDDSPAEIQAFAKEYSVPYPLLVGDGRDDVMAAFGYFGAVPMSIFIRPDGIVSARVPGIATTDAWERRLQALF